MSEILRQQHCHRSNRSTCCWLILQNQHQGRNIKGGASEISTQSFLSRFIYYYAHLGTVANKVCSIVDLNRLHSISTVYLRSDVHFNFLHALIFHFVLVSLLCYSVLRTEINYNCLKCLLTLYPLIVPIYVFNPLANNKCHYSNVRSRKW